MNQVRTLMIAPQPFFQPRGTPFSVLHRLKALSNLGYEVDLLTYHLGEDVKIAGVNIHRIARVPFVKTIAIGPSKRKVILDLYLLVAAGQMLAREKYDLIHSHEEAGFFSTYLSRAYRTLHLYDMHSSLPQQLSNFKFTKSKLLRGIFERLERTTIEGADAVITICPELFNYVHKCFPDKYNGLIENVADNSMVFDSSFADSSVRERIRANGEAIILYAGTFEPYQGLDLLIDSGALVVEQNQNVRFVLVGGKPEQVASYKARVANLNLQPYFTFTGSVAPEQVPAYIDASDILVSPRIEGNNTPLKIYSYLRSGKPIVATNHITHTQVLNQEVSILTDTTPDSFGEGVLSVLSDDGLRQAISKNAQTLAAEKYSYQVYLNKTRKVYEYLESLLSKRRDR